MHWEQGVCSQLNIPCESSEVPSFPPAYRQQGLAESVTLKRQPVPSQKLSADFHGVTGWSLINKSVDAA